MLQQQEALLVDSKGVEYARLVSGVFVRGLGGFGGPKQPAEEVISIPQRAPDCVDEVKTSKDQALLYRLSGFLFYILLIYFLSFILIFFFFFF